MADNFQLGSSETAEACWLKFHQYKIYDTSFKDTPGYICIGADGNFYVEPFVPVPPQTRKQKISDLKLNLDN